MLLDFLKPLLTTFGCFLNLSNNCIPQVDRNVTFYQWTTTGRIVMDDDYSLLNTTAETRFIVHGWTEDSFVPAYETIARNYQKMDSFSNIILVDYGNFSDETYLLAQQIVNTAGNLMGNRIVEMINQEVLNVKRIQIFGHSLGTHVAGTAARIIIAEFGERIARISASDPAGPLFRFPFGFGPFMDNLTRHDADMLDITHTSYTAGTLEAFGTVDTYVALQGLHQPGCQNITLNANATTLLDELVFCDHVLARAYFSESILSCGFRAIRHNILSPNETVIYGQHMPLDTRGIYTLHVNALPPYAQSPNTYPNC